VAGTEYIKKLRQHRKTNKENPKKIPIERNKTSGVAWVENKGAISRWPFLRLYNFFSYFPSPLLAINHIIIYANFTVR